MQIINLIENDSPFLYNYEYPTMELTKKLYRVFLEKPLNMDLMSLWRNSTCMNDYKRIHGHMAGITLDNIYEDEEYRFTDSLRIINQIPIYLINKKMAGMPFQVDFIGSKESIHTPHDKFINDIIIKEDLFDNISTEIDSYLDGNKEEIQMFKDQAYDELNICYLQSKNKHLGGYYRISFCRDEYSVYVGARPDEPGFVSLDKISPKIFIWIDKLKDNYRDLDDYRLILSYSIIHSLIHALLDTQLYGFKPDNTDVLNCLPRQFHDFLEEMIVTAYSLLLMENIWTEEEINKLTNYLRSKPIQYQKGVDLYYCKSNYNFKYNREFVIDSCMNLLIDLKLGEYICWRRCYEAMRDMTEYCIFASIFDHEKLELYKLAFSKNNAGQPDKPTFSCSYNGIIYSPRDLVFFVIYDWVSSHQSITRSQLKSVFPSSLNENYDVFAEVWEKEKLQMTNYYGKVYDPENIISCSDGYLYLCSSWSHLNMENFFQKTQELGIKIKRY